MTIKKLSARAFWWTSLLILACVSCGRDKDGFTSEETALIHRYAAGLEANVPEGTMRVLTIDNPADLAILRAPSVNLSDKALLSDDYEKLCSLMVATVTHPSQDGVGIAGPQVGLNRRIVAVQRFDKEGEPFEVYPNISIVWASDSLAAGPEGCLSVPDRRGDVLRSTEIIIEYDDLALLNGNISGDCSSGCTGCAGSGCPDSGKRIIPTVRDTISGFTAVIFQHEIDHLDGVLYIDRL